MDANKRGCKHENTLLILTRWRGGISGRIGGARPVDVWHCSACKQDVRDWSIMDTPAYKKFAACVERGNGYITSIGKGVFDTLTPLETTRFKNAQADRGDQLRLFD